MATGGLKVVPQHDFEGELKKALKQTERTLTFSCGDALSAIDQVQSLQFAIRAAKLQSRPPIICALTGIKDTVAKKIFRDVTGNSPPKGQLPGDPLYYTAHQQRHIESIWLLQAYASLQLPEETPAGRIECTLLAYEFYAKRFPEAKISFDRYYYLLRLAFFGRNFNFEACSECDSPFLVSLNQEYSSECCPICNNDDAKSK